MRRLRLLGPANVERNPYALKYRTESGVVESDVASVPRFRSRRTVGLLGYLVAEQRPVGREHLALLFWPDETPSKGRANLRRELHNLAKILPDCWQSDRQLVTFVPSANTTVDLYHFRQLEAQERWEEAADLLGGEFLEGLHLAHNQEFEDWLSGVRVRVRGHAEIVLRHLIDGCIARGKYSDALRDARRLLQIAPWDEQTHRCIMRLLAWTGQRGSALRQFENCRRALLEQLDVDPAFETIDLYQHIQSGHLSPPPQLPAFLTEEKGRPGLERPLFVGRDGELERLDSFINAALAGNSQLIFATGGPGRGKTALLEAFAQRAMKRHPNLLVAKGNCNAYFGVGDPYLPYRDLMSMLTGDVEGRWEVGATTSDHARRLWAVFPLVVQTLLEHGPDLIGVFVQGPALLSLALATGQDNAPWFSELREHVKRKATITRDVEQSQLFQQFTEVLRNLAKHSPLLLIVDDLQWADTATVSLLFHLGRRLADAESRILIACAYRPEEVALSLKNERHPLPKVLSEFKRTFGNVWIDLSRIEEIEEREFVDALLDAEPNMLGTSFRAALFDRTRGHPLFTTELLRDMQERGDLLKDADGVWTEAPALDWEMLPSRVEAVIEDRIDRLDPHLQDIIAIASVEGEVFTANVVAAVQNVAERTLLRRLSLDLERSHRLVREQNEIEASQGSLSRYRFCHVLFQQYLYKRLSRGEKRLLHGEIASSLERLHSGRLDEMAVILAHHFYKAGDHEQAYHYYCLAAERAARIYASEEAISNYTRAIELVDRSSPEVDSLAKLHRGRGMAFERIGEFASARVDYTAALQIARAAGDQQVEWRALLDLGKLWASRDYDQTRDYFHAAQMLARRVDDPAFLAVSLNWMGNWHANDENPKKAVAYHQEALRIFDDLENQRELANTLDLLALASMLGGDLVTSATYYDRAIALFRELDDSPRLASSLTGRATTTSSLIYLVSVPTSPSPDAIYDLKESLRIAGEIGSAPDQAWTLYSLGMLHIVQGDYGRALRVARSSLGISSRIGHREYEVGSRHTLGILYAELFAPDQARRHLESALALARDLRSPTWIHFVCGALAGVFLMTDDLTSAQECLKTVISPETPMDTLSKRYCWMRRAELALAQNDSDLALQVVERLIESTPGMLPGQPITYLWKLKAETLAEKGRADEARALLFAANKNAQHSGERFLLWRIHTSLGELFYATGDLEAAQKEYSAAHDHIDELAATLPDESLKDRFRQGAGSVLRIVA